jgi:PPOX class probable F420-dependent enzyme
MMRISRWGLAVRVQVTIDLNAKKKIKQAELPRSLQTLLRGKNFIHVATINSDGTPQVTPTWVDTDGEHILINTAMGRTKMRNIARDPRVSAEISPSSDPYTYTLIKGRVVERVVGDVADDHIDKLSMKYHGTHWKPVSGQRRVILKITAERIATPQ